MANMQLIMENWRHYQLREDLLSRSDYITGVLGVQLPLSEDGAPMQPYSPEVIEEIWREQQLIEQWWAGEDVLLEGPISDWWEGTKEKIATYPETLKMLYIATTDTTKLRSFTKSIKRRGMGVKEKIMKFIDFLIAKASGIQNAAIQKLAQWATDIKGAMQRAAKWVEDITKPWMKALGLVALSVGLQYAWSKISKYAQEFFGCPGTEDDEEGGPADVIPDHAGEVRGSLGLGVAKDCLVALATKFLTDKAKELFGSTLKKVADAGAAVLSGGLSKFWPWLKAIVNGVKFVVAALEPVLKFFKARGGLGPQPVTENLNEAFT